jgi:two-component system, response regulator, stage 0 sporulation protein F
LLGHRSGKEITMSAARAVLSSPYEDQEELLEETPSIRRAPDRVAGGRRARIVLAEDDLEMRTLLVDSLVREGHEVTAAQNGLQMIREIRLLLLRGDPMPIDLIISDERMPGMSGLEFLSVLREARLPIPFILITGFGDERTHERALRLGASAVFDKPFDIDDLKRAVLAVLIGDGSAPAAGGGTAHGPGAVQDSPGMG